jgi:hypothetical protein
MTNKFITLSILTLFFILSASPNMAKAQTAAVSLDVKALNILVKKQVGTTFELSGPFEMTGLEIIGITSSNIIAKVKLVFDGEITIPIPFIGKRYIQLNKSLWLKIKFKPEVKDTTLFVPVKNLTFTTMGVNVSMRSGIMSIMFAFKKWLFSEKGKTLLEKKLKVNLKKRLNSFFGKRSWKMSITLAANKIKLKISPKTKSSAEK